MYGSGGVRWSIMLSTFCLGHGRSSRDADIPLWQALRPETFFKHSTACALDCGHRPTLFPRATCGDRVNGRERGHPLLPVVPLSLWSPRPSRSCGANYVFLNIFVFRSPTRSTFVSFRVLARRKCAKTPGRLPFLIGFGMGFGLDGGHGTRYVDKRRKTRSPFKAAAHPRAPAGTRLISVRACACGSLFVVFKPFRYIRIKSDVPENERGLRKGGGESEKTYDRIEWFFSLLLPSSEASGKCPGRWK